MNSLQTSCAKATTALAEFSALDTFLTSGEAVSDAVALHHANSTPNAEIVSEELHIVQLGDESSPAIPDTKSVQLCGTPQTGEINLREILEDAGSRSTLRMPKVNMQGEFLSFCSNLEYAKDPQGNLYVTVVHEDGPQKMLMRSKQFFSAARASLRAKTGESLKKNDFGLVLDDVAYRLSRTQVPVLQTITRAQKEGDHLYILMSAAPESYLKFNLITGEAEYVPTAPFLPVHLPTHTLPKPIFDKEGAFEAFFDLLGVAEYEDRALIVSILVARLLEPAIEVPSLMIIGEFSTGKTTLARLIKNIIDPTEGPTHPSSDGKDLIRNLAQQFLPAFDNVSALSRKLIDILCTAVTGAGHSRRKIYTNDEEHLVHVKTSCIMTSTGISKLRDDLSSRIFYIRRPRINGKLHGEQVNYEFAKLHPRLLGELLQICRTIREENFQQYTLENERMVDFSGILNLVCRHVFNKPDLAVAVIKRNNHYRGIEDVGGNPEVAATLLFMNDKPSWKGTITELIKAISAKGVGTPDLSLAANAFSRKLKAGEVILKSNGIRVQRLSTGPNGLLYQFTNSDYVAPVQPE